MADPVLNATRQFFPPGYNPADIRLAESSEKVMVNADVIFTVSGGPVAILDILSVCVTADDTTASTMQYQSNPTIGTAATISGASTTLATAAIGTAGATVRLAPTALSTAPVISASTAGGIQLGTNVDNNIVVPAGTISLVIGVGSTTGTWKHYLRYVPLKVGAYVVGT